MRRDVRRAGGAGKHIQRLFAPVDDTYVVDCFYAETLLYALAVAFSVTCADSSRITGRECQRSIGHKAKYKKHTLCFQIQNYLRLLFYLV